MGRPKRQQQQEAGAPAWMLTYGDMVTLLLCFFVILVAMSEVKKDVRFDAVMESLRKAFGGYEGAVGVVPLNDVAANTLIQRLLELEVPVHVEPNQSHSDDEGIEGRNFRVTNVRDGLQVVVGGKITFDRFSAMLKPEAKELIAKIAQRLQGYNTKILVRGHATQEPLPGDSMYEDAHDLSYARARAVAKELERSGVRAARVLTVAVGNSEPLVRQAYTEDRHALNRRVEILVTEDLVDDYAGTTFLDELKEPSDGGP